MVLLDLPSAICVLRRFHLFVTFGRGRAEVISFIVQQTPAPVALNAYVRHEPSTAERHFSSTIAAKTSRRLAS